MPNIPNAFVPTTYVWDVTQLATLDVNSPEFKNLLIRLYQNINNIALVLNMKDTGYYMLNEFTNSQLFFANPSGADALNYRPVTRIVINFGSLPNTTSKSVAHNIPILSTTTFTRIYGASSNNTQTSFIPLPLASPTLSENIKLEVTDTDVIVTTGSNRTSYTTTYIILEYLQN